MNQAIPKTLLPIVIVLFLNGCLAEKVAKQKQADALQATLYSYASSIRWGYFDQAYGFRKYEKGEYPELPQNLTQIRVTSYDVIHPPTLIADDVAVQMVEISYYLLDYQKLKKLSDRQVWTFDQDKKRWYLESEIPKFE